MTEATAFVRGYSWSNEVSPSSALKHIFDWSDDGEDFRSTPTPEHRQPLSDIGPWGFPSYRYWSERASRLGVPGQIEIRRPETYHEAAYDEAEFADLEGYDPDSIMSSKRWMDLSDELLQLTEEDDKQTRSFLEPILNVPSVVLQSTPVADCVVYCQPFQTVSPKPRHDLRSTINLFNTIAEDFEEQFLRERVAVNKVQCLPGPPVFRPVELVAPKPKHARAIHIEAMEAQAHLIAQETPHTWSKDNVYCELGYPAPAKICAIPVLHAPNAVAFPSKMHVKSIEKAADYTHFPEEVSESRSTSGQGRSHRPAMQNGAPYRFKAAYSTLFPGTIMNINWAYFESEKFGQDFVRTRPASHGHCISSKENIAYWSVSREAGTLADSSSSHNLILQGRYGVVRPYPREVNESQNKMGRVVPSLQDIMDQDSAKERRFSPAMEEALPYEAENRKRSLARKLVYCIKKAFTF
ncbi:hypothetical protein FRC02_009578 [Tulasnella sp. 418]|nr:hypothetical protein FRC02_009578 [Tulasnella sp. 418]